MYNIKIIDIKKIYEFTSMSHRKLQKISKVIPKSKKVTN